MAKIITSNQQGFPRVIELRHGAILATIAHAIWIAADPTLSYELSWDGPNYSRQDSMGTRGTITFKGQQVVGVFCDDNSPRAPWRSKSAYDLGTRLEGMPASLLSLVNAQALKYMIDNYNGKVGPIIASAFWTKGEYLTSVEPWEDVFIHGAHLIRVEIMETEAAIAEWKSEFNFSISQTNLLRSLFNRRVLRRRVPISLSNEEFRVLTANGQEGLVPSRELLNSIGIAF